MTDPASQEPNRGLRPGYTGLALLFLLLLLASLAARFWAGHRATTFTGPAHIASGGDTVFLSIADDLIRLTPGGEIISIHSAPETSLHEVPIDLRFLPDGRLLIAEQQPARIRICEPESWSCTGVVTASAGVIQRQFKITPGAKGEWLLTDARGDTLWSLRPGQEPVKIVAEGTLAGPNDLSFDPDGHLWIADTDHRRILELVPSDENGWIQGREHQAANEFSVNGHFYPVMLVQTSDRRWWVTQQGEVSEPGAYLFIYHPQEGVQDRVELPPGAFATDLVALNDAVLVTDLERFVVYRVDTETLKVSTWGDKRLLAYFRDVREQRTLHDRASMLAMAGVFVFGLLMILAAIRATPAKRRWTQVPAPFDLESVPERVPKTRGVHWLERDPKFERSLRLLEYLSYGLFIALFVGGLMIYAWARSQAGPEPGPEIDANLDQLLLIMILGGLLLALLIPLVRFSKKAFQLRLGTDGRKIFIRLENGRELAVEPSHVAFTGRAILYEQYTLPLVGGKQQRAIYQPGEVETWLGPLLRKAPKLNAWEATPSSSLHYCCFI
jgi:hypothetical protein